ncbi:ATP-binding protein [Pollutimonas bauzanensis]|uniref:ATP-binding protein n=1 Tax=Pollutimonas bauzanensis TaxID=658167 RepID=UPI003342437F
MAVVILAWIYFVCRLVKRFNGLEERTRVPLEREVARHSRALQESTEANTAKNVFLASLSHELRTPLTGISGAVQLLKETGLDTRQREYARMISYANTTLLEILDDMLTFSRIEAGKIDTQILPFNLRIAIDDMMSLQTIQAQTRGVALIRDVDLDVPDVLFGDRRKLNQVLLNIIGNAIKFTDEGSVTVSVSRRNLASGKVQLSFSVTDTGIGVPADQCEEIFKPFVQAEDVDGGRRGGTGLGLAICQRLIQSMGGTISLVSAPNEGTCVSFCLDFEIALNPPEFADGNLDGILTDQLRSLTVLVVEDDEIHRLVCTRYLALNGHHPLVAGDGRQVLHIMQGQQRTIDAILMDLNLPGISGIDLAQQIRELDGMRWKNVPVIVMSADVSHDAMERALISGASAFLSKPFTSAELNSALHLATAGPTGVVVVPEPVRRASIQANRVDPASLLDMAWIHAEIEDLGVSMLLELLNMFRSSIATTLGEISTAAAHRNWTSVSACAHRLQGAAANLGMVRVIGTARNLQKVAAERAVDTAAAARLVDELELLCQDSCDALRLVVLGVGDQSITLATHRND